MGVTDGAILQALGVTPTSDLLNAVREASTLGKYEPVLNTYDAIQNVFHPNEMGNGDLGKSLEQVPRGRMEKEGQVEEPEERQVPLKQGVDQLGEQVPKQRENPSFSVPFSLSVDVGEEFEGRFTFGNITTLFTSSHFQSHVPSHVQRTWKTLSVGTRIGGVILKGEVGGTRGNNGFREVAMGIPSMGMGIPSTGIPSIPIPSTNVQDGMTPGGGVESRREMEGVVYKSIGDRRERKAEALNKAYQALNTGYEGEGLKGYEREGFNTGYERGSGVLPGVGNVGEYPSVREGVEYPKLTEIVIDVPLYPIPLASLHSLDYYFHDVPCYESLRLREELGTYKGGDVIQKLQAGFHLQKNDIKTEVLRNRNFAMVTF